MSLAILIVGIVILAITILVFILPVDVEIALAAHGRVDFRVRIFYFFRLFSWKAVKQASARTSGTKQNSPTIVSRVYRTVQVEGLWNKIVLLIKRLTAGIRIRNVESDLKISLGDDYYTGMLIGMLLPIVLFLNTQFLSRLRILPVFEEDLIFEGYMSGELRTRPIALLAPVVAFILSGPGWRARRILAGGK